MFLANKATVATIFGLLISVTVTHCGDDESSSGASIIGCFNRAANTYVPCPGDGRCVDPNSGIEVNCLTDSDASDTGGGVPFADTQGGGGQPGNCASPQCVVGSKACVAGQNGYISCSAAENECPQWGPITTCAEGTECFEGQCIVVGQCNPVFSCTELGQKGCNGTAVVQCKILPGGCTEWLPVLECGAGGCEAGACKNGGGTVAEPVVDCRTLYICVDKCGSDSICRNNCIASAPPEDIAPFVTYENCLILNGCQSMIASGKVGGFLACAYEHCLTEYESCLGAVKAGDATCSEMMVCMNLCPANDNSCLQLCGESGTKEAQLTYFKILACAEDQCKGKSGADWTNCTNTMCTAQVDACNAAQDSLP